MLSTRCGVHHAALITLRRTWIWPVTRGSSDALSLLLPTLGPLQRSFLAQFTAWLDTGASRPPGMTALHEAVAAGNAALVEYLLDVSAHR